MIFSIYLITNKANGKVYVGQTQKTVEFRWRQHVTTAARKNNMLIYRAIAKYGAEVFEVKTLEAVETKNQANWLESFYIGVTKANNPEFGYNLTAGGEGTVGLKFSDEHRKNLSEAHKWQVGENSPSYGRIVSEETRKKMSEAKIGRQTHPQSLEARLKIGAAHIGKIVSEESRQRMSEAKRQYWSRKKAQLAANEGK
jgi:group I intron endonuclease